MQYVSVDNFRVLPKTPGVYLFRDEKKRVLYVGKATQLRSRVASYFSGHDSRGERIFTMVSKAKMLSYEETDTVLEAVILEANLIKQYQPRYNVDLKDDKSFSYIALTRDDFPRFIFVRERELLTQEKQYKRLYGPYTSKQQAQMVLKIVRKIFPFHSNAQNTEKGCLHFQIGLCPGPYEGEITQEAYRKNIRNIEYVLRGQKKRLITTLEKEMNLFAKEERFEEALQKKNELFALRHIRDIALLKQQKEKNDIQNKGRYECYDISHISGENPVASMVVFENREPRPSQYRKFSIKHVTGINDVGMMREVLARRFRHEEWEFPEAIILDGGKGHLHMAEKLFEGFDIQKVGILAVAKGPTRKKVDVFASTSFPPNEEIQRDKDLLEKLREEAHRFAITFHRKRRTKDFLSF